MSRKLGFDFRSACRRLDPALHRKLYPDPTREIDIRNRLDRIADQISELAWRRNAQGTADKVAELVDEQRRLRGALAKAGGKHPPARRLTTRKSSESKGSRP